jgi:hypothetical protein
MKLISLFIAITISTIAHAQDAKNFLVYHLRGNGYYVRDKYRIPLKIGTSLSLSDAVTLSVQSEITIICNNYSLFYIQNKDADHAMSISLGQFGDSCGILKSNLSLNYLKYIWKKLKEESPTIDDNQPENLNEIGGVVRGCPDLVFDMIRDTIRIYKKYFSIKYQNQDTNSVFEFALYDDEDASRPFYKSKVNKNRLIAFNDNIVKLLLPDKNYYWTILRNHEAVCGKKIIIRVGDDEYKNILTSTKENEFHLLSNHDQYLVNAFVFDKDNMIAEAYHYITLAYEPHKPDLGLQILKQDLESRFEIK